MRTMLCIFFLVGLVGCDQESAPSSLPPIVKCKPTWETRTFLNWHKRECDARDANDCKPMGYATVLVEFVHDGCREFKNVIDNQSAFGQGYAPGHTFVVIDAASDALTRSMFDSKRYKGTLCQVFYFNDLPKPDRKNPNEDQWFTPLCEDATSSVDSECRSQLSGKRLYSP